MTQKLICLALMAHLLVAPIAWALGTLMDRSGASASSRHWVWSAAFWAGPATVLAILATPWLPARRLMGVLVPTPMEMAQAGLDPAPSQGPAITTILLAIVAAGAVARLAWLGARLWRLRGVTARATPRPDEIAGLPVRLSAELTSPLLAGVRRPTILLPVRFGAPDMAEAAALIGRHEAAHADRGDNLRLLAEEVAVAIFWFDIIQLRVRARLGEAREEICDAVAVAGVGPQGRGLYARSLLDCLNARATGLIATALIGQPRRHAAMRIDAILTPKPQRPRAALAAGLLALLVASGAGAVAWSAGLAPHAQAPTTPQELSSHKTAAKLGPIDITADKVQADNSHHTTLWIGNATVSGITKATMDGLFIDGRAATEADLATLPQKRFASIKATFTAHELERLDAKTKPD